jgi:hypothetical protein
MKQRPGVVRETSLAGGQGIKKLSLILISILRGNVGKIVGQA